MTRVAPFEIAVHTHGPTVLRVCRAVLGAGADADDAWSETFLAALRAWPDLPPETNVQAWLVRVARNKAVDIIRASARRAIPTDNLPHDRAPDADPHAADIWQAVATLPARQREAVAYHYFGGLPHTETAELTGSTPAAVRRAAADGVAALRRVLAADDSEHPVPGAKATDAPKPTHGIPAKAPR